MGFIVCTQRRGHYNNQIKNDKLSGAYSTNEMRNAYQVLVAKPEGKRPLGTDTPLGKTLA
jgi:hypothetical protein